MSRRVGVETLCAATAFRRVIIVLVLTMIPLVSAGAQSNDDQLAKIEKSLKEEISKELPDWKCHSIKPIQGSVHVVIDHCELGDILVKIAVVEYDKVESAENAFKDLRFHLRIEEQAATRNKREELHLIKEDLAVGDEGFVADIRGSEAVHFRKGNFLVSISVPRPDNNKDVFFSRNFAQHVAKALESQ